MFFFLIFLCTTIFSDKEMEITTILKINDSVQVQPKPIRCNHHHQHQHRRDVRRSPSSNLTKTKSFSFIASISKSILKCHRCLIKFFSKFAAGSRHRRQGFVILEKNDITTFETNFGPKFDFIMTSDDSALPPDHNQVVREHHRKHRRHHHHHYQLLPPLVPEKKKTIVLDLDETLVHAIPQPPPPAYDFTIKPTIDGVTMQFYVLKRPGVDKFLESISKKYEVVVFTAGLEPYASMLLDILDPKGLISHRLYRDSCKQLVTGKYVKDLSKIGRELGKVVIVDDNPKSYSLQRANAIPIKRFEDDAEDRELKKLMRFFKSYCDGYEDMRDAVKQYFGGAATINKPRRLLDPSLTSPDF